MRERSENTWDFIDSTEAASLIDTRLQAHCAAHVAVSAAKALAEPQDDFGHYAMTWDESLRLAVSSVFGGNGTRIGVSIADLALNVVQDGTVVDTFSLRDRTIEEAFAWLRTHVPSGTELARPSEWPTHSVATGASFSASPEPLAVLHAAFANAAAVCRRIRHDKHHAKPVRLWPHHFDIATLVLLEPDKDPEEAKSINVGLSPGDGSYSLPYWYVVPFPAPESPDLPSIQGDGTWHTEGFLAAVLPFETFAGAGDAGAQSDHVNVFIDSAYAGCLELLSG